MIRRTVFVVLACVIAASAYATEIDKVLVVVNNNVITESEFQETYARIKADLLARGGQPPPEAEFKKRVLNHMILEEIERQLAKRAGIKVPDAEVKDALAGIARENHLRPDQLKAALEKQGMDYDLLRQNIRTQLLAQRLAQRQVARHVVVTDDEVNAYLAQPDAKRTLKRARYNISHILFHISPSDSPERIKEIRAKAEEVHRKIVDGDMDFREAAISYSQADDALDGGKLGWRAPSQLPDMFIAALNRIGKGGVTDVIRSSNGFHILKLNDVEGGLPQEVTQYKVRHILIRTDEFTSVKEAVERLKKIRARILNGESFAQMALAHSDDTVSGVQGGELGWISPGDVVRPVAEAMEKLKVGGISEPVPTPYGVDLIQLEAERKAKPADMDRSIARRQLRAIKTQEKMQEWTQRVRDQAYVKIVNPVAPDT